MTSLGSACVFRGEMREPMSQPLVQLGDGIAGLRGLRDVSLVLSVLPSGETQAPFDVAPGPALWAAVELALAPTGTVAFMAERPILAATSSPST